MAVRYTYLNFHCSPTVVPSVVASRRLEQYLVYRMQQTGVKVVSLRHFVFGVRRIFLFPLKMALRLPHEIKGITICDDGGTHTPPAIPLPPSFSYYATLRSCIFLALRISIKPSDLTYLLRIKWSLKCVHPSL